MVLLTLPAGASVPLVSISLCYLKELLYNNKGNRNLLLILGSSQEACASGGIGQEARL